MLTCCHCGKQPEPRYRCSECGGLPLCLGCALEAGLLGVEALMKDRAQKSRIAREAAREKKELS